MQTIHSSIAIIGKGPAGMLAALMLNKKNIAACLVGKYAEASDERTTAIMTPGIQFLQKLGLWDALKPQATALQAIRIVDGTNRLLRSRTVQFAAKEIGQDAFGYNIPNKILNNTLKQKVAQSSFITSLEENIMHYDFNENEKAKAKLGSGKELIADLFIAADGKNSKARTELDIATNETIHNQVACVLNFFHEYAHNNISTELHTRQGPFTQVPLAGNKSSLIWTVSSQEADSIKALSASLLEAHIEKKMQSMLGKVTLASKLQTWPLTTKIAETFAKNRTLLIGEAAHSFPPIGAQGLNLTIRDIESIDQILEQKLNSKALETEYIKSRKADIKSRAMAVDLLSKSLRSNLPTWQTARLLGFELLHNISSFRRVFIKEGLSPNKKILSLLYKFF